MGQIFVLVQFTSYSPGYSQFLKKNGFPPVYYSKGCVVPYVPTGALICDSLQCIMSTEIEVLLCNVLRNFKKNV